MENVVLIIHLILALCLIGVVLLQRSEGGGLGMGGGGGGAVSARGVATALGKLTWLFGIAFFATSIALTVISAEKSSGGSVVDRLGTDLPAAEQPAATEVPSIEGAEDLLGTPAEDTTTTPRAD